MAKKFFKKFKERFQLVKNSNFFNKTFKNIKFIGFIKAITSVGNINI